MDVKSAIAAVVDRQDLSNDDMIAVMREIMSGKATDAQIAGFLVAMRLKGETIEEIAGAVQVMRELVVPVKINVPHLVDTCGTGGDGASLFNVSTASAFVVAASGGYVAKHGNQSVSSSSGSADLLRELGVNIDISPSEVARCVEQLGVGFMFAPAHHSAMKHAIGPRRELGLRTLFNVIGPMTNPAGVVNQVIGVFSPALCRPIAEVLKRLGSEHVLVVHSDDGLDEISLAGSTQVAELHHGEITEYTIKPEDFGIQRQSLSGLSVDSPSASLALINTALTKNPDPVGQKAADIIALNAGAAIYAAGLSDTLKEGIILAQDAIGSGLAKEKMSELASFTQCFA